MALDLRRRVFARFYDRLMDSYEEEMAPRKRELLGGLEGTVVEIGPGTGANLVHLPAGVRWIGVEPNVHMHPFLHEKAEALGLDVELRTLDAGSLPFEDEEVDTVISTLVLCSVPDVAAVVREIHRVLTPGGSFCFWEHVLAPHGRVRRALQHAMTPFQRVFADGCRANRELAADIRAAGFRSVELEEFRVPKGLGPPWIRPHIAGRPQR